MMRWIYSFISLLIGMGVSQAQKISYTRALATGDFVTIYYTLEGSQPGQEFQVELYSSHDQYQKPLQQVRGAVGSHILAGELHRIEWGTRKEMGSYHGELTFEVQARLVYSPIVILFPQSMEQLRRGKTYEVRWKGGHSHLPLQLTLIKKDGPEIPIAVISNQGYYRWTVPRKIKQATDYYLEISEPGKYSQHRAVTGKFTIGR